MKQTQNIQFSRIRNGIKTLPGVHSSWKWVKSREAEIRCVPRLKPLLADFFSLLQVNEPSALAEAFVKGLSKTEVRSACGILRNIQTFYALLQHPRQVSGVLARPVPRRSTHRFRLLVVSAISPSPKHAGGLRVLDILKRLQALCNYEIYLYSVSSGEQNQQIEGATEGPYRCARFANYTVFGEKDLFAWLRSLQIGIDDFNAIQFEWGFHLDAFASLYNAAPEKFLTHQENCLRRCSMELNRNGYSLAGEQSANYLSMLSRHAFLEALGYANIQTHIVLTQEDHAFVRRFNPGCLEIIPTGLSDEFISHHEFRGAVQDNQLCFVGYFDHLPNREAILWFLEKVWPQLKSVITGLKLVVVGSGDITNLRARFTDGVEFTGEVDSVVPYIQKSAVCIAPLISGAGFRGKVNQYAILGKPTVATSIAISGLAYKNGESILVADSAEDFARAVIRLITDKDYSRFLGGSARQIASAHYAWEPIIQRLDQLYRGGQAQNAT
jgi:glycosyltransferase involved in cell wall biosynthesis